MNPVAAGRVSGDARLSEKAGQFTESVIREMTRLALAHNAVNLSQGFPDFAAPEEIKAAARDAITRDINQYAITWGAKSLRNAIADKFQRTQGLTIDPEREITVCCGSTEAMMAAMMAIINPGDEVVVFEPFYENYGPDAILSGASPRFVRLRAPDWSFDADELARAFSNKTKAIILNTPNNPTGKVFSRAEMETIRDLCVRHNAFLITDEIYEHMLYDGATHISAATIDGLRERTITINALSKTYSVTGWRVGWAIAPPEVTSANPQSARFSYGRRRGAVAGGGRDCVAVSRFLLRTIGERLFAAARSSARNFKRRRLQVLHAARRVLHHDGYFRVRICKRCRLRAPSCERNRRRRRARFELLPQSRRRRAAAPLHLLQKRIHIRRSRKAANKAAPRKRLTALSYASVSSVLRGTVSDVSLNFSAERWRFHSWRRCFRRWHSNR